MMLALHWCFPLDFSIKLVDSLAWSNILVFGYPMLIFFFIVSVLCSSKHQLAVTNNLKQAHRAASLENCASERLRKGAKEHRYKECFNKHKYVFSV